MLNTQQRRLSAFIFILLGLSGCDTPNNNINIALGPDASTTQQLSQQVLNSYGVNNDDYNAHFLPFDKALKGLQDGSIDISMSFLGLPTNGIKSLQAATGDVTLLSLPEEVIADIEQHSDYQRFTIPTSSYQFLTKEVSTLTAYAVLMANTQTINDQMGYQLARIMYNATLAPLPHAQSHFLSLKYALDGGSHLPIHPGAKRFYEEQGLTVTLPVAQLSAAGAKQEFIFGTGSQGGTYYPLGGELTTRWNEQLPSVNFTNVATQASIENLHSLREGKMDLGMTVNVSAVNALQGKGAFAEQAVENIAFIGQLYPEVFQVVTRKRGDLSSFADIKRQ
ncbi:TAXI family TRAP transporter solute-binding subunit [Oceanisphaera pacifica]|uniref:TAXI family TRAP transporter solute-binding subunit n=1 Tax=Oceanisphaera pacifica TaxID=2818389 RepID=A0ABS3NFZ1_9GAMM|nr:TAXI family TRAP transporter solute-binding subunit [Oceanisphaera pacifica]MBO1519486.1 TAXI family TRAP transporter solute-binding subunit [Oceanisphaera pacifica]